MAAGRFTELGELLGFSEESHESMLKAAVQRYGEGAFAQAETILVGLLSLSETDARPLKLLAATVLAQDKHVEAEQLYERAWEADPDDLYTLVALAELKLKILKLDEAIPLFETLFARDPDSMHPAANRGRHLVRAFHDKLG